mgnify:CR=1 FL=1
MPKPTLAQRNSFKTWLRKYKTKFSNTTIPEFYLDDVLSSKSSGITTTMDVTVLPFGNFDNINVVNNITGVSTSLMYIPALPNDTITLSYGSTSTTLKMVGDDTGLKLGDETYNLNDTIPFGRGVGLKIRGLGGALVESTTAPIYDVQVSQALIDEGSSVNFVVTTTDVNVGTTLYFNTNGTVTADDFGVAPGDSNPSLTGSFQIVSDGTANGGIATITRSLVAEGSETASDDDEYFNLVIKTGSSGSSGIAVTTSRDVYIEDVLPTFSISQDKTTVAEGDTVTFTITTTNVADGQELAYNVVAESGSTVNTADLEQSVNQEFQIQSNVGIVTITPSYDFLLTENDEFKLIIRDPGATITSGEIVATSGVTTITDVTPQYPTLTVSKTSIDELETDDFITLTCNAADSTSPSENYYYIFEVVSGTVTQQDFRGSHYQGRLELDESDTINIKRDHTTEGVETFRFSLRTGGYDGTVVAYSPTITINDSSRTPESASDGFTFGPVLVTRDGGNTENATDYYELCNIDSLPENSKIALFIDNSGSMTTDTIRASYDLLVSKLNEKNITIITVENGEEDWITPFLTELA